MPQLHGLELLENGVEGLEEIATLAARCPRLRRLDLRENPVASEPGYAKAVKKHLPGLVWHNNQSQKRQLAGTRSDMVAWTPRSTPSTASTGTRAARAWRA